MLLADMLQRVRVCCCFKYRKQCHSENDSFLQLSRIRENSEFNLCISSDSSSEQQSSSIEGYISDNCTVL